ncbi:MAG: hypothetical protein R3C44_14625 [Chloroflexota bacterium]
METLWKKGFAGPLVSNYMVRHLEELGQANYPAVNQIEMSPYVYTYRHEVVAFCEENAIAIEAYSPLTKARKLDDPRLVTVAGDTTRRRPRY